MSIIKESSKITLKIVFAIIAAEAFIFINIPTISYIDKQISEAQQVSKERTEDLKREIEQIRLRIDDIYKMMRKSK